MTQQLSNPPPPPAPRHASPTLRVTRFEDFQQIERLEQAHGLETQPEVDWLSLWINNPLWPRLAGHWPNGWVLQAPTGEIVGSVVNIPSLYRYKGRDLICSNGRAWVCAPEYRGFAVWLMDEYFNQPNVDLFLNTTVGANAKQTIASYSTPVPVGDWQSIAYFITNHRGFARKALRKKNMAGAPVMAQPLGAALWLKDALTQKAIPLPADGVTIELTQKFDARFDAFFQELEILNPNRLLAARGSKSLNWHFGIPLRRGMVRIVTATRNHLLRAFCILKLKHYPGGLRRMQLVDYQTIEKSQDAPDEDKLLAPITKAALRHAAARKCDVLEHVGCDLPKMRQFEALATYRRAIPSWPYFYHAPDPALAAELKDKSVWDPSAYDGDASFE